MTSTYEEIINKFDEHLTKSGKRYYSEFYIGVSDDAATQLFNKHYVDKENSWWIYKTAISSEDAKRVAKHYQDLGMRGGNGDGNMVYCYVVTSLTTE